MSLPDQFADGAEVEALDPSTHEWVPATVLRAAPYRGLPGWDVLYGSGGSGWNHRLRERAKPSLDAATLRRKADQAWEMAGCARADRDTADERRWTAEAQRLERLLRDTLSKP